MYPKKLLVSISKELFEFLLAEKRKTGASLAEIVRRCIKKYFGKE